MNRDILTGVRGLSVLEVVVALAMMGILVFSSMSLTNLGAKGYGFARQRVDAANKMMTIRSMLGDPTTCNLNFAGKKLPTAPPPLSDAPQGFLSTLVARDGSVVFDINAPQPDRDVFVHDFRPFPLEKANPNNRFGNAPLLVYFRVGSLSMGSPVFAMRTDLMVENASGDGVTISSCRGINDSVSLWEEDGANLYFAGGNVLIGNPNIFLPPDPAKKAVTLPQALDPNSEAPRDETLFGQDPLAGLIAADPPPPPLPGEIGVSDGIQGMTPAEINRATTPPFSWALRIQNDAHAIAFYYRSDASLKDQVRSIDGLSLVNRLRGVRYRGRIDNEPKLGLVAQEVQKVIPEAVTSMPNQPYLTVSYDLLMAPLIEAVKELDQNSMHQASEIEAIRKSLRK